MSGRVIAILCIDADPDSPEHGGFRYDSPDKLAWNWLPELASKTMFLRKETVQKHGVTVCFSWFARADLQIREIYSDAGWSLRKFSHVWEELSAAGDEIAWHPHSWRWSDDARCWYNETSDSDYILDSLDVGFKAFEETFGAAPLACRTGINFHNNSSMRELDRLGIKTDLSCHPGLRFSYSKSKVGGRIREGMNWSRSPEDPYYPSRHDFQRPSQSDALRVLEIPITVWRRGPTNMGFWKGLSPIRNRNGLALARPAFKGWFLPSVCGEHFRFQTGVNEVFEKAKTKGLAHYASYLHSDDIANGGYSHLAENVEYLITAAKAHRIELEFTSATQAYETFKQSLEHQHIRG